MLRFTAQSTSTRDFIRKKIGRRMVTEQQTRMLRRHAIEQMGLSVKQAEDWVAFYDIYGPTNSHIQWQNTLLYRIALLKAATDHDKSADTLDPTRVRDAPTST